MPKSGDIIYQYKNCRILRDHNIIREDLWVKNGKIIDPEKLFYDEQKGADVQIFCNNAILAPGLIDTQINGAFGVDFSSSEDKLIEGVNLVSKGLLAHGVTSYVPTVITSCCEYYKQALPKLYKRPGGKHGAEVLGIHLEGPFISKDKLGAHPPQFVRKFDNGFDDLVDVYGSLKDVVIVTLAPELKNADEVTQELVKRGVIVSVGHSESNLTTGEQTVNCGACSITHLFNAMLPFHHRDPGLVGLLTSERIPKDRTVFYGMIADGIHTHPAALRIAHRVHPNGIVLITDAIQAMGLPDGVHRLGDTLVEVNGLKAVVHGTSVLCGSVATLISCVRHYKKQAHCSIVEALEAASLHPAQLLGITHSKGTLDYTTDADFIVLDDDLNVQATYIAGDMVWEEKNAPKRKVNHLTKY